MRYELRGICSKSSEKLIIAFTTIPSDATELVLTLLGYHQTTAIAEAFKKIPLNITSLNLSCCLLYLLCLTDYIEDEAIRSIQAIKIIEGELIADIITETIILAKDGKYYRDRKPVTVSVTISLDEIKCSLAQVFAALPFSITSLDLSGNFLFEKMPAAFLTVLLNNIPKTVIKLDLSYNKLYYQIPHYEEAISEIRHPKLPKTSRVECSKSVEEIVAVLKSIPKHIKELSLKGNNLGEMPIDDLKTILGAIPVGVESLDLSENNFEEFDESVLMDVIRAIPSGVKQIIIGDQIVHRGCSVRLELPPIAGRKPSAALAIHGLYAQKLEEPASSCVLPSKLTIGGE